MVFSKKIKDILNFMYEVYECGDPDFEIVIKPHTICICEFVTESGKIIRKHQSIGIIPGNYDYWQTLPDRLVYKEKAIKSTIKIYAISEMIEKGVI